MDLIVERAKEFITPNCFNTLFVKFAFGENGLACEKLLLSKVLGIGIVLGSLFLKAPQIFSIYRARSARGLSVMMFVLELFMATSNLAYNYAQGLPFNTYGEYAFMTVQGAILFFQIFYYNNDMGLKFFILCGAYGAFFYTSLFGVLSLEILTQIQMAQLGLFVLARMPQIMSNFSNKGTGELSLVTMLLSAGGSLARVFTTLQETNDPLMLSSFVLAVVLNFTIVFQILYYGKGEDSDKKKKRTKKTQ